MEEDEEAQPIKPDSPSSPPPSAAFVLAARALGVESESEVDEEAETSCNDDCYSDIADEVELGAEEEEPETEEQRKVREDGEDKAEKKFQDTVCRLNNQIGKEKAARRELEEELGLTGNETLEERRVKLREQAVQMNLVKAEDTDEEKDHRMLRLAVTCGTIREGKLFALTTRLLLRNYLTPFQCFVLKLSVQLRSEHQLESVLRLPFGG